MFESLKDAIHWQREFGGVKENRFWDEEFELRNPQKPNSSD